MDFTFSGIKQEFKDRLSLLSNWQKTLFYGVYDRLADVVAYISAKVVYVAEYLYREANWNTAQNRESLLYQSDYLSYTPFRKKGASGKVKISADSGFSGSYTYTGESITIPRWTPMTDDTGNIEIYTTEQKIYYKNTVGNLEINVKEGIPKEFTYIASGVADETISIYSDSIDNDEIEMFIVDANGTVLADIEIIGEGDNPEKLFFVNDTDTYYCQISNNYDFKNVKFQFGDGITSRKLDPNERVLIKYADTQGDEGNIQNSAVITTIGKTLTDALGNEATIYVTNDEEISDGSDIEDIENIRFYAPRLFQAGYRAGGYNDWTTILENQDAVYKAKVWSADDIGSTDPDDLNKIFITAISNDGNALTSDQQDAIVAVLKDLKSVTEAIEWEPLKIIFLLAKIEAKVSNQPFEVIKGQVKDALTDNYGILKTDFQTNIYRSNYVNLLDDLTNIHHLEDETSEILHMEKTDASDDEFIHTVSSHIIKVSYTSSDTSEKDNQIYLTPDTAEIWMRRKISSVWQDPVLIGKDVSGTWVGQEGDIGPSTYAISNSVINYTTNTVGFQVDTILNNPGTYGVNNPSAAQADGYLLFIAYKTQDGNTTPGQKDHIRLPTSDLITNVDEEFVFTTFEYI